MKNNKNSFQKHLYHDFTWSDHFAKQSHWIKPSDYKNNCYQIPKNLDDSIKKLIKYLNIPDKGIDLPIVNKSKKDQFNLTKEDKEWIYNEYKEDFILWNLINNDPNQFMKVI